GERRDERQLGGKPRTERFQVVGGLRPGLLLRLGIIFGGQFLDAGAENLGEQRHIGRQQRAHGEVGLGTGDHGSGSQSVPSLVSFRIMPIAWSSSRIRSDSSNFFALRAAFRASTSAMIFWKSKSS